MHRIVALAATVAVAAACGGDASSAEKSGGAAAPLTLRLGTVENDSAPYAPYVNEFVRNVEETSGGSIDVEVAWEAVPWNPESEKTLATMVSDGEIDFALVPTRVWDELGVTTMQALQAPFLVDNFELLNAIVGSELADEVLAGLDPLGVEGLALWPDSLRHPLGFEHSLLTAADFDGAKLRVPPSDASFRVLRAIGAEPVASDFPAGVGDFDGVETALNTARDLPALGTLTANITFYPKVNALVANGEVFESLSDDQRDALRRAATDTIAYVVDANPTEAALAEQYCAAGGSVALADAADLAELAELAAPVLAELEDDDEATRIIDEIREMKAETTGNSATAAAACGTVVDEVSAAGPPSEVSELPDGVYRIEISLDDVEAWGETNAHGSTGIWTTEVHDGIWVTTCVPLDLPGTDCGNAEHGCTCGTGPLRGTGNTVWFVYDVEMVSELTGCQLPISQNEPGHCGPGDDARMEWSIDGDTLTLSNDDRIESWTRIEGASADEVMSTEVTDTALPATTESEPVGETAPVDSGAATDTFPEGVYLAESPSGEVVTMTYGDGVWRRILEDGTVDCISAYTVEDGRIWLTSSSDVRWACGNPANLQFLDATWTFDGDQLRLTDINSDPNAVREFSLPWTRIAVDRDDQIEPGEFPQGVYRIVGLDNGVSMLVTEVIMDGVNAGYHRDGRFDCSTIYTVEGDQFTLTESSDPSKNCGNPPNTRYFDAIWSFDGEQLQLSDSEGNPLDGWFGVPRTRIAVGGDPTAPVDEEETPDSGG
jgi:TRAP-type C4-dicarboxylate transport system substrate-binding protein